MKRSLFLYLFIIALLFNVFTYMYYSKQAAFENERYKKLDTKLRDTLDIVTNQLSDANYFSLESNQNAQNYFVGNESDKAIDYMKVIPQVNDALLNYNDNPAGNPYTGQEQIGAKKFIINKVKVLNHRWVIADFSDGQFWGEVLLKYFVNEDGTISFEVIQSLLHQK
jgi:hypothetical protein